MVDPGTPLDVALEGFLAHARLEQGLSPRTVEAYGRDLTRLVEHLVARGVAAPAELERVHLSSFLASLARQGLGARSRARALVSVRRFVRHLQASGRLAGDGRRELAPPHRDRKGAPVTIGADDTVHKFGTQDKVSFGSTSSVANGRSRTWRSAAKLAVAPMRHSRVAPERSTSFPRWQTRTAPTLGPARSDRIVASNRRTQRKSCFAPTWRDKRPRWKDASASGGTTAIASTTTGAH